jgi:hypothetical protein
MERIVFMIRPQGFQEGPIGSFFFFSPFDERGVGIDQILQG